MSMDIEKSYKSYKEGSSQEKRHVIASGVGAVIGGIYGGYPGMQIGMAIAGYLFTPDPPKDKDTYNDDHTRRRSKLDPVPDVIGTDICPGKPIWVGKNTFGMYDSGQLPEMGDPGNESAWKDFIDMMASMKIGQYAEFAINFANRYNNYTSMHHLGVLYINKKPQWFWTMLSDMFENYEDPLSPFDPITFMSGSQGYWFNAVDLEDIINQPVHENLVFGFKGFFADFSQLTTEPEQSSIRIDPYSFHQMNPKEFTMGPLTTFPSFEAEVNRSDVHMSPESNRGGKSMVSSAWFYWESTPGVRTSLNVEGYFNNINAKYNKLVGYSSNTTWFPLVADPVESTVIYPGSDYSGVQDGDLIEEWLEDNITKGRGTILQCTDIFDDRQYICVFRNWWNPYQGRGVFGIDTVNHHHAEYGAKIDLYYHDMTEDDCPVTSVLYDYEYSITESDYNGGQFKPRFAFGSMRVDDTYIYLFGHRIQTDFVLSDEREIVSGENSYTKCYADFSQYPDDYWNGYYAALQQESFWIWCQIQKQTSTYIEVSHDNPITGGWGKVPAAGEVVRLRRHRINDAGLAICGEGSTTTLLVTNVPDVPDWCVPAASVWQKAGFAGSTNQKSCSYDDDSDTTITLSEALSRDPVPGEILYFTEPDEEFDEDETDPLISTESDSSELIQMLLDLGFTNTNVRWTQFRSNEFSFSHTVVLRINKNTGAITTFKDDRVWHPHTYAFSWWTADLDWYTCQTDKQAFVYGLESLYGTQFAARTYIIDFTSGVEEEIHMQNQYANGHTPLWCYHGCVSVKEWNGSAYVDSWYSILTSYDSFDGLNNSVGQGNHFLKLGEGKFSNKKVYSSNILLREGLDINRRGIKKILYREGQATGPLYGGIYTASYPNENDYHIGKVAVHNTIYFRIYKGNHATIYPTNELWKYIPPSDKNPAGVLYMLHKTKMEDSPNNDVWQWNRMDTTPSFRMVQSGYHGAGQGNWYHCDESPPTIIAEFWRDYEDPRYIPEDLEYNLTVYEAQQICNEYIPATIYRPEGEYHITERRFQFSNTYHDSKKMYDVWQEILETCQGFISQCLWDTVNNYHWKIIVPNQDETPVHYFGRDSAVLTSNQLSDDESRIYADFSAYPDNFWKGDEIDFGEVMDHWNPWPDSQTNIIIEQTSTYIELGISLADYWPDAKQFTLIKDNIREGSFTFAEKSYIRRPNKVRIEFKNRMLGYIKDVAEAEDAYRLDVLGEVEKIDFYKMHGIKRATQAGRMAQRILDQWNYQKYVCGFETDIMGMTLCFGEIIAVKHETTGWDYKWFRIVSIEEMMDFEVKFELEEFNPYTYHDSGVPVMNGSAYGGFPLPYQPNHVENFTVHEDIEHNRLYFAFDPPQYDSGFFVGARIYYYDGSNYVYFAIVAETVSSVRLAQDVSETDTTIYYDNNYLTGSFPSEGILWLGDEMIYYHGVDTTNYAFTNCIRGYKDTIISEYLEEDDIYIKLRSDATQYAEIPSGWEGTTKTFKAAAFTVQQLTADIAAAPSADIDIIGYGLLPYFPESIHQPISELPELNYLFETLGLSGEIDEVERLIETLGLSDSLTVPETLVNIIEGLGLNDSTTVTGTVIQIVEDLGFNDSVTVSETITYLTESLGLGDDYAVYSTEYLTETLGLNDSATVVETLTKIIETLGMGDTVVSDIALYITETLGIGDTKSVVETIIAITESLGLGDVKSVQETIVQIAETLGLGDVKNVVEIITESLGLGDSMTIPETLAHLSETLGLGDSKVVSETITYLTESLGLGDDYVDSIVTAGPDMRVTQTIIQTLEQAANPDMRVTQTIIQTLEQAANPNVRNTQTIIQLLEKSETIPKYNETYFTEYSGIDYPPPHWTKHWSTTAVLPKMAESTSLSKKVLFYDQIGNGRTTFCWDYIGQCYDVEILTCIAVNTASDYCCGPACRVGGSSGNEIGYLLYIGNINNRIDLYRYTAGSSSGSLTTYSYTITDNAYNWIRMRVEGDNIKARIWGYSDTEPSTWHIDYTDTSPLTDEGYVGLGGFSGDGYVHFFGGYNLDTETQGTLLLQNNLL